MPHKTGSTRPSCWRALDMLRSAPSSATPGQVQRPSRATLPNTTQLVAGAENHERPGPAATSRRSVMCPLVFFGGSTILRTAAAGCSAPRAQPTAGTSLTNHEREVVVGGFAGGPNNLPAQLTTFIGREHEAVKILELVRRRHIRLM